MLAQTWVVNGIGEKKWSYVYHLKVQSAGILIDEMQGVKEKEESRLIL